MTATKQIQDAWFAGAVNRPMNPDNAYGLQCKDVADDYCIALFGNWVNTIRPGNGKDVFNNASDEFFIKVANDPNNPNQIPPHGAIINWGPSRAVPEGHVAVVDSANQNNVTVIMQDGYVQYPARLVTLGYQLPNGAMCIGWLIPKLAPEIPRATDAEINQAYREILERADGADADGLAHYRNFTLDFVRVDLKNSQEYRDLQNHKAAAAQAAADAAVRQAALEAEARRLSEERAALDAQEAKKQAEAEHIKTSIEQVIVPAEATPPVPTQPTIPAPKQPNPLVRILFDLLLKILKKK